MPTLYFIIACLIALNIYILIKIRDNKEYFKPTNINDKNGLASKEYFELTNVYDKNGLASNEFIMEDTDGHRITVIYDVRLGDFTVRHARNRENLSLNKDPIQRIRQESKYNSENVDSNFLAPGESRTKLFRRVSRRKINSKIRTVSGSI